MASLHYTHGLPLAYLQREEADDWLVVANAVRHVAGVRLLSNLQRELLLLLLLHRLPLGPEPPQDPVRPGRLALLAAAAGGWRRRTEREDDRILTTSMEYILYHGLGEYSIRIGWRV